ncbi:MAG: hypothetical protein JNL12_03440 [Planctomycetes bacterium]|nr:hypothetical protein [Planctomycetota bacterium]
MRTLLRTAVAALAVFTACGGGAVGSTFVGETQLLTSLGGGQVLGRFDVQFPAEVTAIDRCREQVEFSHRGTAHRYPDVAPTHTRVVRVRHAAGEGTLVVQLGAVPPVEGHAAAPPR